MILELGRSTFFFISPFLSSPKGFVGFEEREYIALFTCIPQFLSLRTALAQVITKDS